jgi:hypothetical protein
VKTSRPLAFGTRIVPGKEILSKNYIRYENIVTFCLVSTLSTIAQYSSSSSRFSYKMEKRQKPGNFQRKETSFGCWGKFQFFHTVCCSLQIVDSSLGMVERARMKC